MKQFIEVADVKKFKQGMLNSSNKLGLSWAKLTKSSDWTYFNFLQIWFGRIGEVNLVCMFYLIYLTWYIWFSISVFFTFQTFCLVDWILQIQLFRYGLVNVVQQIWLSRFGLVPNEKIWLCRLSFVFWVWYIGS